jgi:thymidylate synthase
MFVPFVHKTTTATTNTEHPENQYLELLRQALESGEEQVDSGTGVKTYSLFGAQMRFDLSRGFPLLTTKRVYWKGVLHELYWFMSGQSNIKYLVDNDVHIWDDYPYKIYVEKLERSNQKVDLTKEDFIAKIKNDAEFAKAHGELPHIYGESWRRWPAHDGRGVDQLQWVIDELRKDPDAHNTLVSSWNPEYLYSMAAKGTGARFPICHNMYQVNIKKGKVCLQLYQRSADIFLGVPFNIASYALLTAIIAKILGREPGEFIHTFGDYHMYENHRGAVTEQLTRTPKLFPAISFTKDFKTLDEFRPEYVQLEGYDPHGTIKAELVVAGGFNKKLHSTNS